MKRSKDEQNLSWVAAVDLWPGIPSRKNVLDDEQTRFVARDQHGRVLVEYDGPFDEAVVEVDTALEVFGNLFEVNEQDVKFVTIWK